MDLVLRRRRPRPRLEVVNALATAHGTRSHSGGITHGAQLQIISV